MLASISAIAMLLAEIAGDQRHTKNVRACAAHSLESMTSQDILETGLAAYFSEVCIRRPT
jgi:uncharacterized protein (UPF0147 family)